MTSQQSGPTSQQGDLSSAAPCSGSAEPLSVVSRSLLALVGFYQLVSAHRPSPCRYWPSCSSYAREAVESHGAARGSWLAAGRLARCHPWGGSGVDEVPAVLGGRA